MLRKDLIWNNVCNSGEHSSPECGWDGGDCLHFLSQFPNCVVDEPSVSGCLKMFTSDVQIIPSFSTTCVILVHSKSMLEMDTAMEVHITQLSAVLMVMIVIFTDFSILIVMLRKFCG